MTPSLTCPARAGWVYLVGAGPGDPDLLTLRGLELLQSADVVLHDELIGMALLDLPKPDAVLVPVGKRGGDRQSKDARQASIHERMIAEARAGRSVVRLKGGDPFLFGRGSEECIALREDGVPYEVVPGVSSPVGATAYAGVPLTHRSLASSVTIVTAITKAGQPFPWSELASVRGTLCVLMGARHMARITRGLMIDAGRSPDTPVILAERVSTPRQRVVESTLGSVADRAVEEKIASPALLLVGEVASLRPTLAWFDEGPLFAKRVLLTRPAHQQAATARALRRRGAEVVPFPLIAIDPPPDPQAVEDAVLRAKDYDLVVFTSENGVRHWWRAIDAKGLDARVFGQAAVAAIGPTTAKRLAAHGIRADIVAKKFVAEDLAAAILERFETQGGASGKKVLLPRAMVAREALPELLREAGASVDVVPVYRTVDAGRPRAAELESWLEEGRVDIVTLTSSSTADKLCELLGPDAAKKLDGVLLASIGPITTATAVGHGLTVDVTAEVSTSDGLVDAIEAHLGRPAP